MQQATYKGYVLWGHAIERKFIEASGVLAVCDTEEEAQDVGLSWARAWVDSHG